MRIAAATRGLTLNELTVQSLLLWLETFHPALLEDVDISLRESFPARPVHQES